jgi:hypothetical protein
MGTLVYTLVLCDRQACIAFIHGIPHSSLPTTRLATLHPNEFRSYPERRSRNDAMKGGLRGAQRAVHIKCVHIRAGAFLSSNTVFVFRRLWWKTGGVVMYCLYRVHSSFILLQPDEFFAWCFSCILPSLYEESQYSLYSAAARAMWQVFPIEKFPIWFSTFIFVVAGNMVFRKQQVICYTFRIVALPVHNLRDSLRRWMCFFEDYIKSVLSRSLFHSHLFNLNSDRFYIGDPDVTRIALHICLSSCVTLAIWCNPPPAPLL